MVILESQSRWLPEQQKEGGQQPDAQTASQCGLVAR